MNEELNIALVEDHPEYANLIQITIEEVGKMKLRWKFSSTEAALRKLQTESSHPDLILLDLSLPGLSGFEALKEFKIIFPKVKIIILTQSDADEDAKKAIQLGANGYLLKSATAEEVVRAINHVRNEGMVIDPQMTSNLITPLTQNNANQKLERPLSARELDVIELAAKGLIRKEAADHLGISESTVITYLSNCYEKLDSQNATGAVAKAFELGILPREKQEITKREESP